MDNNSKYNFSYTPKVGHSANIYISESIFVQLEKYNDEIQYYFKDINLNDLGIYFDNHDLFKCTGLNLKYLIFELETILYNPFVNTVFNTIKHLNFEFNNIETMPVLPPQLETLICGFNKIKRIEKLPSSIIILIAHSNFIEHIDVENCNNLKELNLSFNNIKFYTDVNFPNHINHLNLSHNKLTNVNFEGKTINYMNLNHNLITNIYTLPNELTELYLSGNNILSFTLPERLSNKLTYLNLTGNKLKHIYGNFSVLNELLISNNKLEEIEATFSQIENLYCSNNNIKSFNVPDTVKILCCMGTKMFEIKISDQLIHAYLPFDTLKNIKPFNKFVELYKAQVIFNNEEGDILIKDLAAQVIQKYLKKFMHNNLLWENIYTTKDLKNSDITIFI